MTGVDYLTDVATGAAIGVVTGGIGAGGSAIANTAAKEVSKGVAKGAVKLAVRAGAGAVAGATGNVINGVVKGEEITVGSVTKSALCGVVGVASSHISSNATKFVSADVAKAVIRIGAQATTSGAMDVTMQARHYIFTQVLKHRIKTHLF